ncbi:MAG: MFS transporter [Candidatus Eisenbacteria bacterium]
MSLNGQKASGYSSLFTISFTALLAGQIVSILGDRLGNIALIEMLSIETGRFAAPGSTFELSKLAAAMTLPAIILGPLAGAYIDRVDRKQALIITDVIRGAAVVAIPFLRPALPLWTVYVVVAMLYVANLFFLPARCAIVAEIVSHKSLIKANSILSLGATVATILGFGVGGILASRAGWRTALYIDSVTYFVSAGALTLIRTSVMPPESQPTAQVPYMRIIRDALGEIRRTAALQAGVLAPSLLAVAGAAVYVLGVAIVEGMSPEGTMHVGFLVGLAGAGMAAGCYFTGKTLHNTGRARLAVTGTALAILSLIVIGVVDRLIPIGIAVTAAGFVAGPVLVSSETSIQEETPHRRQATVFAVRDMLMKIAIVSAAGLAAAAGTLLGLQSALIVILGSCLALSLPLLVRYK